MILLKSYQYSKHSLHSLFIFSMRKFTIKRFILYTIEAMADMCGLIKPVRTRFNNNASAVHDLTYPYPPLKDGHVPTHYTLYINFDNFSQREITRDVTRTRAGVRGGVEGARGQQ